jgi:hypothetical protein
MNIRPIMTLALALPLWLFHQSPVLAADPIMTQEEAQVQEQVYGSQLMSEQERTDMRSKMRGAGSDEEREKIRNANHERMKVRAKEQGLSLPDEQPKKGGGMGMRDNMKSMGNRMGDGNRGSGGRGR